ncbi:MAG: hypothetical protein AAFX65_06460 [Cyanobacteria bacterium J06638_7]
MAVLMAFSGPLPATAASLLQHEPAPGEQAQVLLANQRSPFLQKKAGNNQQKSTDKNKKKRAERSASNTKKTTSKKSNNKKADSVRHSKNRKPGNSQKRRIYDAGVRTGYREGVDKRRNRDYRNSYSWGYAKAQQRKQWKSWNSNQWKHYNRTRRNIWLTPVRYNRGYDNNPPWARHSNWGYSRPWGGGWYNNSSNSLPWSWWGGQALGWGINALTTALIVNNAVNNAIRQRQPTVQVPQSTYSIYYGSVEPFDNTGVNFVVSNAGSSYQMQADCADGLLNGEVPATLAEAELINTACQVTYGST